MVTFRVTFIGLEATIKSKKAFPRMSRATGPISAFSNPDLKTLNKTAKAIPDGILQRLSRRCGSRRLGVYPILPGVTRRQGRRANAASGGMNSDLGHG